MIKLLLITLVLCAFTTRASVAGDVANTMKGFFKGAFNEDIPDVTDCLDGATSIFNDLKECYNDIKTRDLEHLTDAIVHLGHAISHMPSAVSSCKSMSSQSKAEIEKIAEMMKHPLKIAGKVAKAVLFHGVGIFKDAKAAKNDYEAHNFESFGKDLGDIIKICFLKRSDIEKTPKENVKDFAIGMATAVLKDFVGSLSDCFKDGGQVIIEINAAIQ
jgi:hypothetical protein